jgi:hypothetical protein
MSMVLPSIGGSDCHNRAQVERAYTISSNLVFTMKDLVREMRSGNFRGMIRQAEH